MPGLQSVVPGTNDFRRHIYRADLWAKFPIWESQRRQCSAQFYRVNMAVTFRLHEFIRRDLSVILRTAHEVDQVRDLIVNNLMVYDIRSRQFRRMIENQTLTSTDHFIHELYCFAVSPIETMEQYDLRAEYVTKTQTRMQTTLPAVPRQGFLYEDEEEVDAPARDRAAARTHITIDLADDSSDENPQIETTSRPAAPSSATVTSVPAPAATSRASPEVIEVDDVIVDEPEQQLVMEPVELENQNMLSFRVDIIDDFDNPTAGPSGINTSIVLPINLTNDHIEDSDSDTEIDVGIDASQQNRSLSDEEEDEVEVVGTVKARQDRTPEVYDLSDDDDEDEFNRTTTVINYAPISFENVGLSQVKTKQETDSTTGEEAANEEDGAEATQSVTANEDEADEEDNELIEVQDDAPSCAQEVQNNEPVSVNEDEGVSDSDATEVDHEVDHPSSSPLAKD